MLQKTGTARFTVDKEQELKKFENEKAEKIRTAKDEADKIVREAR